MSATRLSRTLESRVCRCAAMAAAAFLWASCGGTEPTRTLTTSVPSTSTTTTTSVPGLSGTIAVQNTPCVAPSDGPVTCTFVASATGGQAPYTYSWKFTTPTGSVTVTGPQVSPEIGCGFSTGAMTFNLTIALTITPASGSQKVIDGTQQIGRQSGVCNVV